jgi:hypothetical protein
MRSRFSLGEVSVFYIDCVYFTLWKAHGHTHVHNTDGRAVRI